MGRKKERNCIGRFYPDEFNIICIIDTPEGKRACTIPCKLPPHSKLPGICRNGKNCAYLHNKYAAHAPRAMPPTLTPIYSPIFDSTLGYPGEGPSKIAGELRISDSGMRYSK
eukprot:scaffold24642_cov141-Isochrysis_galbana.AAC.2